ncbi:hypothetical protein CONPUDRAFT_128745 [Coniophora puteana RWD-64-598 SS2]|uniref:DUF1690-domain-containing protein n=1 Tax=Coniophora puteana (strain RWD-64-598) TaxID=741705 RepID=A0A5M3MG81_CONPW|nr:uncharacterized protein CONPUDRAFT_128745 [Coniophora puteana RWD-64-598 SS2]EIW77764.1 hypothetical protein CONPUDRAFT_128745 [Coniophora puteana RWD-64-598 SS2]
MGASQSKPGDDDVVFRNETPVQFSQDVVDQLASRAESSETTPERQTSLDAHIRARMHTELERLRQEEQSVIEQIESALEKENLDRERAGLSSRTEADGESEGGEAKEGGELEIKSSATVMGDLEEVRAKVDKYQARKSLEDLPEVKAAGDAVFECYKSNPSTPLDCWSHVSAFKAAIADAESKYLSSLR